MTRARWRVALCLVASVAPVAILANVLRITTTGLLYEYASSDAAKKFSHDLAGILMIALAIVFFLLVLWTTERMMLRFSRNRARALLQTAIALLVIAAAIPAGYFWHETQQAKTVDRFLKRADKLQESGKDLEAIVFLDRYLHIRPNDMDVRVRMVHAVDRVATNPLRKIRAMELYRDTWNLDLNRIELGARCADLAIELARYDEALAASAKTSPDGPSLICGWIVTAIPTPSADGRCSR